MLGTGFGSAGKNNSETGLEKQMVGQVGTAQEEQPRQGCLSEHWGPCQGRVFNLAKEKNEPRSPRSSAPVQSSRLLFGCLSLQVPKHPGAASQTPLKLLVQLVLAPLGKTMYSLRSCSGFFCT